MHFLIDAQLPPALCQLLNRHGHHAEHVQDAGLREADDTAIWSYATGHALCIITKDEDFALRTAFRAEGPPVLWLRVGNCTNRALVAWLEPLIADIVGRFEQGERLVEVS